VHYALDHRNQQQPLNTTALENVGGQHVNVYVTGFGAFGGVAENPTSILVNDLIERKFSDYQGINLCDAAVVPVSI